MTNIVLRLYPLRLATTLAVLAWLIAMCSGCSTAPVAHHDYTGQLAAKAFADAHTHGVPLNTRGEHLPSGRLPTVGWAHYQAPAPFVWPSSATQCVAAPHFDAPAFTYAPDQSEGLHEIASEIRQASSDANFRQRMSNMDQIVRDLDQSAANASLRSIADSLSQANLRQTMGLR